MASYLAGNLRRDTVTLMLSKAEAEALKAQSQKYYDEQWLPKWNEREKAFEAERKRLARLEAEAEEKAEKNADMVSEGLMPNGQPMPSNGVAA